MIIKKKVKVIAFAKYYQGLFILNIITIEKVILVTIFINILITNFNFINFTIMRLIAINKKSYPI